MRFRYLLMIGLLFGLTTSGISAQVPPPTEPFPTFELVPLVPATATAPPTDESSDTTEVEPSPTFSLPFTLEPLLPNLTPSPTQQSVFPIQPGTIEGIINENVLSARYSFEAPSGASVTIRMETTSGNLDPVLTLFGPDETMVGRNDDLEPGNRNSQIALTLSQSGTYIIEASRFAQGTTAAIGTFRLSLQISGVQITPTADDPLSQPPFAVNYQIIDYQSVIANRLDINQNDQTTRYYAIRGTQGDLIRATWTRTSNNVEGNLRIFNAALVEISRQTQTRTGEAIVYTTAPTNGWYLIEVSALSGSGNFDLYVSRLAAVNMPIGANLNGLFLPETPTSSYLINARIGDQITVTMFSTETESGVQPELVLLDLSLREIMRANGERFATLRTTIPRSGPYILQANNRVAGTGGGYNIRLNSVPVEVEQLNTRDVTYNNEYTGTLTENTSGVYYRFSGKVNELVTLQLNALADDLNPYLILMDSDLNELASNDDVGMSLNSRISQFRLPKDGDYYVLVTRSGLTNGTTTGDYLLAVTAGEIVLTDGVLTVTLSWLSSADLNLFVRDPAGQILSWSNPQLPDTGTLQIDSNTHCQTPSTQPLEHAFWTDASALSGDYQIWVWYQQVCDTPAPVDFALRAILDRQTLINTTAQLLPNQRYESSVRIGIEDARPVGVILESGMIHEPSEQQQASEGGDILIRYGETLYGEITPQRYAQFYQFQGVEGEMVTLTVETISGDLDPILILRDAQDHNLPNAINDDISSENSDSQLEYVLPYTGRYIIAVTRYGVRDGITVGAYELRVTRAAY